MAQARWDTSAADPADLCTPEVLEEISRGAPDPHDCVMRALEKAKADSPPSNSAAGGASTQTHKIGETAKQPDCTAKIEGLQECKVPYYFKPKAGNIKLGVEITLEAVSDKEVPVNPFYARVDLIQVGVFFALPCS